jgi:Fe-S cluster assembly protein SufD
MNVQRLKTPAEMGYEAAFASPPTSAQARFAEVGLPHRRVEAFKYTDLRTLMSEAQSVPAVPTEAEIKAHKPQTGLVFINGYFVESLSQLPKGVTKSLHIPLNLEIAQENALLTLHAAFAAPVASFLIEGEVEKPLEVHFFGQAGFPHLAFALGKGASLTLNETTKGHCVIEVKLYESAKFTQIRTQESGNETFSTLLAELESQAELTQFTLLTGGKLTRHQHFVRLLGDEARVNLSGISLLNEASHGDTTLTIEHVGLRGESREMFKTILAEGSKGVFQGKIIVQKDAQKTDGKMASNSVMLSDDCEMDNKPELEIYADDVLCGHGATCGQLDDDLLFYMQARGIAAAEAKALLLQAFCGEALEAVDNETLKEALSDKMIAALKSFA